MSGPLVSVCCVTYNQADYVEEALRSIFEQTYRNIEIIVVDDGSTDGTLSRIEALQRISPFPMMVRTQANTGRVGRNINTALASATGEYVRLLSLDDRFTADSTELMVQLMERDSNIQFAAADRATVIDSAGTITGKASDSPFVNRATGEVTVLELLGMEHRWGGTFYIQNAIFRKEAVDLAGGCDEELLGDDITFRIRLFKYMIDSGRVEFAILNTSAFMYRIHDRNLHKNAKRQIDTLVQVCNKYFGGLPSPVLKEWIGHAVMLNMENLKEILDYRAVNCGCEELRCEIIDQVDGFRTRILKNYLSVSLPYTLVLLDSARRSLYRIVRRLGLPRTAYHWLGVEGVVYKSLLSRRRGKQEQSHGRTA